VYDTRKCVRGTYSFFVVSVAALNFQKYFFIMLYCPLSCGAARVNVDGMVCCWWASLSYFLFFSSFSLKNYNLTLFIVGILILVLIYFISNFCSWPFCRSFICFKFRHSISIYQILYFSIWSLFFFSNMFSLVLL
jgi:hypothetical protein